MEKDGEGFEIISGFKENQQPPLNHKKTKKIIAYPENCYTTVFAATRWSVPSIHFPVELINIKQILKNVLRK